MKVDFDGRVQNLDLPVSRPLWPLLEAVTNSIHAIDDAVPASPGEITIRILREKDENALDYGDSSRSLDPIVGFQIEDNGVGFTDPNFGSFETCDSRHKASRGAKGIGRLLWLKAFDAISVVSYFRENDTAFVRKFRFALPDGVLDGEKQECSLDVPLRTTIKLAEWRSEYAGACPKKAPTIADYLINHLILVFLNPEAPKIELVDDAEEKPVCLNERFRERFQQMGHSEDVRIGNAGFQLHHFRLITPEPEKHRVQLVASYREVTEIKLGDRYPNLKTRLIDSDQNTFVYLGILTGDLLNRKVNQNRTGFDLASAGELSNDGEPSLPEIENAALEGVLCHLAPFLETVRRKATEKLTRFVQEEHPEYRALIPQMTKRIDEFSPSAGSRELLRRINEIQLEEEMATREEEVRLTSEGVETQEDYRIRYQAFLERVTRESETRLAQYVTHRRVILDLVEERLKRRDDEKYPLEEEIHELIFPLRSTSDEPGVWGHQNLWIVDERLAYHHWLASDKPLKSQEALESDSDDRPDFLIMNRPGAFSPSDESNAVLSSVTLVELKRPGRGRKGSDAKDPIEQLYGYVDQIREGKVRTSDGRSIKVGTGTAFFAYLICDIDPGTEYERMTRTKGMEPTPDGLGYFIFNKPLNTYLEVITFDKLVKDARQRNRMLFRKLGVDEKLLHAEFQKAQDTVNRTSAPLNA